MQIFVGSLSFSATKEDVRQLFEQFGAVDSVTILMNKKGKKSRGFCFVEMPEEQAARSAIAGLDGREFMGRALKVMAARPKPIKEPGPEQPEDMRPRDRDEGFPGRQFPSRESFESAVGFTPVSKKPIRFKGGRRSSSYLRRVAHKTDQEIQALKEARPWQKRRGPARPWQRREGPPKPWQRSEGPAKPRQKSEDRSKSWQKPRVSAEKPHSKSEGRSKPWQKSEGSARPWQKSEGRSKPWQKSEGPARPWKKTGGPSKPRRNTRGPKQKGRFSSR